MTFTTYVLFIIKFTNTGNVAGINYFEEWSQPTKVWTESESEELQPPDQLTCCPLRRSFPCQDLWKQHEHKDYYYSLVTDNTLLHTDEHKKQLILRQPCS